MARKLTDTVQLKLRFPEALRRRIERAATVRELSMNSEIVRRLEESFRSEDIRAAVRAELQAQFGPDSEFWNSPRLKVARAPTGDWPDEHKEGEKGK